MNVSASESSALDPNVELYLRVKSDVESQRLTPNQRLVASDLAATYETTRARARTVLALLEHDGLVIHEPKRGARVRLISEDEAIDVMNAREPLEALIARSAATNATEAEIEELSRKFDLMVRADAEGNLLEYSRIHRDFHRTIWSSSGQKTATQLVAMLRSRMARFQGRTMLVAHRHVHSLEEHRSILDAMVARDPDAAECAIRVHLTNVRNALLELKRMSEGNDQPVR